MSRAEQLVLDYERTGVSVADHPMLLLRPSLPKRVKSSRDVLSLPSGTRVTVAGLVICRQRPGTASGVVFVTMEDELGFLNLVLWARVFEEHQHVATTSRMLLVHGRIERSDDPPPGSRTRPPDPDAPGSVVYVIADRLEKLDARAPAELRGMGSMSRDFH
jgi:error-prone DNA polymerase